MSSRLMQAARVCLALDALLYASIGVLVLLRPEFMREPGVASVTITGITTTRTWGALFAGAGLSGLILASRREWLVPGLILVVTLGLSIVTARIAGIWIDGIEDRQWTELRREVFGFVLGLVALGMALAGRRKHRNEPAACARRRSDTIGTDRGF